MMNNFTVYIKENYSFLRNTQLSHTPKKSNTENKIRPFCITLLLLVLSWSLNGASVYWVTNTSDSGSGSFRLAITNANASVSTIPDTIKFAIPGDTAHMISPTYNLPVISDPLYIDGLSQSGSSNNSWPATLKIELSGLRIGGLGEGLIITAGHCTVSGLVINEFSLNGIRMVTGSYNKVETCFIGTDTTGFSDLGNGRSGIFIGSNSSGNLIGGSSYQERNLISGNDLTGITMDGVNTKHNKVLGNFIGTDASGLGPLGNGGKANVNSDLYRAVYLNNSTSYNVIGDAGPEEGNVISGNLGHGIYINSGIFNLVQNNFIGTDATGSNALGNQYSGVVIYAGRHNTIGGGILQNRGNVICANEIGIALTSYSAPAKNNNIFDNIIGSSKGGLPIGNNEGVSLTMNAISNQIEWNRISHNYGNAITLSGSGVYNNLIVFDTIFQNGGLAIDLNDDGVSKNDSLDIDGGANKSLNSPSLIQTFINVDGKIEVHGFYKGQADKQYEIYFYANANCDLEIPPLNYGEGKQPIGNITINTAASGEADFQAEFDGTRAPGRHLTAIAVDENKNTSEFSQCISIPNWPTLGNFSNGEIKSVVVDSTGLLYIGGYFDSIGNQPIKYLATWDGAFWSEVGGGTNGPVHTLHFDNQGGLLVGGEFTTVGGFTSANRIAKWDGTNWSTFGTGMNDIVRVITTSPTGTIYAGGDFTTVDGNNQIRGVARWNVIQWVPLGYGAQMVRSIVVAPNSEVYVGGYIDVPGVTNTQKIAKWDGAVWSGLYTSSTAGINDLVFKSNGYLYAADGYRLLEYDGNFWKTIFYANQSIRTLILDEQENLYIGGGFNITDSQGRSVNNLVVYDGGFLKTIGGGVLSNHVNDLALYGGSLYSGGLFQVANGVPAKNIARFWTSYLDLEPSSSSNENTQFITSESGWELPFKVSVFPNPTNSEININYLLGKPSNVSVKIYNIESRLVYERLYTNVESGYHLVKWNLLSRRGVKCENGFYVVKVKTSNGVVTKRIILQ